LGLLYEWAEATLHCQLDDMLEKFVIPDGRQLDSLVQFLRTRANRPERNLKSLATVANQAVAIRLFLMWASDPTNQGSAHPKTAQQIARERAALIEMFRPIASYTGAAQRIPPLWKQQLDKINAVIGPNRDSSGRLELPLSFNERNPFRPPSRLRNWLMYAIAYQCGLRLGELLKLTQRECY
jgi:integrase